MITTAELIALRDRIAPLTAMFEHQNDITGIIAARAVIDLDHLARLLEDRNSFAQTSWRLAVKKKRDGKQKSK